MRWHAIPASTARQRKALRCTIAGTTEPIASRFTGGLLRHCQRWHHEGTASEAYAVATKTVSENPVIEGQGFCDQRGAAVVFCEMPLLAVVFQIISTCAVHLATSNGLDLTEERLRLDRLPATAAASFFPAASGGFAREAKKPSAAVLRCAARLSGAGRSLPGRTTAIEVAMGAARRKDGDTTMATIGTFTEPRTASPASVKTLTPQRQGRSSSPTEKRQRQGPDYRIFAGATEFGAAWKKTARETRARISLGQARRSELPGADLRLPGRGRGRRELQPHLVPPQRRLIQPDHAPRLCGGGASSCSWPRRRSGIRRSGWSDVRFLRLAHPDQIALPASASRAPGEVA